MTAQRIEAAKPTKPKGSAEGESLVGTADAPNSLSQKGSRMTDTTEQQAVTVAQDRSDADLLRLIAKDHARLAPNAYHSAETLMQIADRLASVSSASAETLWGLDKDAVALLKKAATFLDSAAGAGLELDDLDAMEIVGGLHEMVAFDSSNCFHDDAALFLDGKIAGTVPEDITPEIEALIAWARDNQAFPKGNPGGEGRGHIDENARFQLRDLLAAIDAEDCAASPEPVPATNQAGEVATAVELLEQYAGFIRDDVKADDLERHPYLPLIEQTIAALATQPATSQEGEQVIAAAYRAGYEQACEDNGDRVDEDDLEEEIALYLAATPTPPTLSEDLRTLQDAVRRIIARCEAVEDENSDQLGKSQTEASSGFLRGERSLAKSIRRELHDLTRTALTRAQVKAS